MTKQAHPNLLTKSFNYDYSITHKCFYPNVGCSTNCRPCRKWFIAKCL